MEEALQNQTKVLSRAGLLAGITLETALSLDFLYSILNLARYGFPPTGSAYASLFPQPDPSRLFLATVFPFLYCLVFSYWLKPIRRISATLLLLGAFFADTLLGVDFLWRAPITVPLLLPQTFPDQIGNFGFLTVAFFFLAIMLGVGSDLALRFIVGKGVEDVERKTYYINQSPKVVYAAFLSGSSSANLRGFREEARSEEEGSQFLVLKKKFVNTDEVILALCPDSKSPTTGTMLATITYNRNAFVLKHSKSASQTRDSIVNDLIERCKAIYRIAEGEEVDEISDLASAKAYETAVAPTRSKVLVGRIFWSELETYFKMAIVLTVLALVVFGIAAYDHYGNVDFSGILALAFFALLGEIGIAIREERNKRKKAPSAWLT